MKFDAKYKITIKKIKIYQAIVECLIYLVSQTRFNIVFAIQKLTRFNLNSTKIAHEATKKLFRYLQNIKNLNITYEQNEKLINYIDVDYVENSIIKKLTKIYIFSLHESVFNWSSKFQNCVTFSLCEIEYITQTQIFKKII